MKRTHVPVVIVCVMMLVGFVATWVGAADPSASKATAPAVSLCKSPYKKKSVLTKTLQALVHSHKRWVEYRGNPNAKRVELCQADRSRAALEEVNLRDATLVGANLSGARLDSADLRRTNFKGAVLSSVTGLTQAQLNAACVEDQTKLPPEVSRPSPCATTTKKEKRP